MLRMLMLMIGFMFLGGCVKAEEDQLFADDPAVNAMADKLASEQLETVKSIEQTVTQHTAELAEIKKLLEDKKSSCEAEVPAKAATPTAWRDNALLKQPGPTWNWEGDWNPTVEEARAHLQSEHGIDVDGFALHELKTIHDNIHNGYGYLYGITTTTVSNCPGGVCPTPQRRRR